MKLTKKHIAVAGLGAICALSTVAGASVFASNYKMSAVAETADVPSSAYYYDNMRDEKGNEYTLAKKILRSF